MTRDGAPGAPLPGRSRTRTNRTKAELAAALEELRAYHEDLLSSLQDGVIILDSDGRIVSVNQAAEELTGFSRSQVAGRPAQRSVSAAVTARRTHRENGGDEQEPRGLRRAHASGRTAHGSP